VADMTSEPISQATDDHGSVGANGLAPGAAPKRLSVWRKLGYGIGGLGEPLMMNAMTFYLMIFYTDVVGIDSKVIGSALFVAILWDAVTDPVMGYLSDRTHSRYGRRRPYILVGGILLAVAFLLVWRVPGTLPASYTFAVFLLATVFLKTAHTIAVVPYGALGAEITMDYDERTSVFAYRTGMLMLGTVGGAGLLNFALLFESREQGYLTGTWLIALIAVVCYLIVVGTTREDPSLQHTRKIPALRSFVATVYNRGLNKGFLIMIGVFLIQIAGQMLGGGMFPFLLSYYIGKPTWMMPGILLYTIGAFFLLPFWKKVGDWTDKKQAYMISMVLVGVMGGLSFFMWTPAHPWLFLVWCGLVSACSGGVQLYPPSMIADIIDEDELKTGLRREGAFMGMLTFTQKAAQSLAALWTGVGLSLVGYVPNEVQSERTVLLMRLFLVLPLFTSLIAAYVLWRFPLSRERMAEIRRTLDARNAIDT